MPAPIAVTDTNTAGRCPRRGPKCDRPRHHHGMFRGWRPFAWTMAMAAMVALVVPAMLEAGPQITFRRVDGTTVSGELLAVKADHFVVKVDGAEVNLMFEQLAPASVYEARAAVADPHDPQVHLDLGLYCIEHDLVEEAVREFTQAREAGDILLSRANDLLVRGRTMAAHTLFRRAQQLEQTGKFTDALAQYERVWTHYPDVESVRDDLKQSILTLRRALNLPQELPPVVAVPGANPNANPGGANAGNPGGNPNAGANPANPAGAFDDDSTFTSRQKREYADRRRELEQVQRRLENGMAAMREGLNQEGTRNAHRKYDEADQEFYTAMQMLEKLRPNLRDWMPQLRRQVEIVGSQVEQNLLRLAVTQAHFWARQEDLDQTAKWVGRILAIDPDNEDALKIRNILTEKALRAR